MRQASFQSTFVGCSRLSRTVLAWLLPTLLPIAFGQVSLTTAQIAKRVSPAVVVIQGKTDSAEVQGSGFIVSKDGKIVTNLHVIRDLKTARVHLANGEIFDSVSVLAIDERRDLAVVQIAGFNLPILELGDSDFLTVGEPLVIVGSPRGLEGTVTAGILSSVRDSGEGYKVLQTDAAVNPGNSGGPLVNTKGQAVGVVSFKLRSTEGLNFAIPINYVRGLLNNLHEPIALEQMRITLAPAPSAVHDSGLSLKESLDWLKEQLHLSTYRYIQHIHGHTLNVTVTTAPVRFDSCGVSFDRIIGSAESEVAGGYQSQETEHWTVPLGSVAGGVVVPALFGEPGWAVVLSMRSKVVLYIYHTTSSFLEAIAGQTIRTAGDDQNGSNILDSVNMIFPDESLAHRVQAQFLHAVALCQGK